jgi:hypothetical protein
MWAKMQIEACKTFIESTLPAMTKELMLESWDITVKYSRPEADDGVLARCKTDIDYRWAVITIYDESILDEKELTRVLYHEMVHIVLSPFDFYRNARKPENSAESRVYVYALENVVTHLERVLMARHKE